MKKRPGLAHFLKKSAYQIIEKRKHSCKRVGRREERHVSKLDEHLEVVFERALVLKRIFTLTSK